MALYYIKKTLAELLQDCEQDLLFYSHFSAQQNNRHDIISVDIPRTSFVGNHEQLQTHLEHWSRLQYSSPRYYLQGDMNAGNIRFLLGLFPFYPQEALPSEPQYTSLNIAYVDTKNALRGISFCFRNDDPTQWFLATTTHTFDSLEKREVTILASVTSGELSLKKPEVFQQHESSLHDLIDRVKAEIDSPEIASVFEELIQNRASGQVSFERLQSQYNMVSEVAAHKRMIREQLIAEVAEEKRPQLNNIFDSQPMMINTLWYYLRDSEKKHAFIDTAIQIENQSESISQALHDRSTEKYDQYQFASSIYKKNIYKLLCDLAISNNGLSKTEVSEKINLISKPLLRIADKDRHPALRKSLMVITNVICAFFLFVPNLINLAQNNTFIFFSETKTGQDTRKMNNDLLTNLNIK